MRRGRRACSSSRLRGGKSLEPLQDVRVDNLAIHVNGDRMATAWQHPQLHRLAVDEPLRNLCRTTRIDRPVALAVQDEHRRANLGELVADDRTHSAQLVDAPRRAYAIAVQLLDGVRMPEVDVAAGVVPAHDSSEDREQRWEQTRQPDRRRQGRDRPNAMIVRGQVQRERAAHRLPSDHNLRALRGKVVERVLHPCRPVLPARALQLLRRRAVTRQRRRMAEESLFGKRLTEPAQLGRCAGESVDEQGAARTIPEAPGRHHLRVERIQRSRSHPSSIWIVQFALGDTVARDG